MKGQIQIIEIKDNIEGEALLKVIDGKIFVEGVETIDNELIGMAFKDFAEMIQENKNDFNSDYPNAIIIKIMKPKHFKESTVELKKPESMTMKNADHYISIRKMGNAYPYGKLHYGIESNFYFMVIFG